MERHVIDRAAELVSGLVVVAMAEEGFLEVAGLVEVGLE